MTKKKNTSNNSKSNNKNSKKKTTNTKTKTNKTNPKKGNRKKGFSMVELLAVIVILGVISTIGIFSVSRLIEKSRENYYLTQQEQLVLAAQAYANVNRNILPKETGAISTVYLQELYDKKFITEKIVDQNKNECYPEKTKDASGKEVEGSRVEIYKSSQGDYKYVGYLECYACKKDKGSSSSTCYDPKDRLGPDITITIPNVSGNTILNKSHKITITIKGNSSDSNIKVSSYSYKIYVDGAVKKSSGLIVNNKQRTVDISEDLYKYVPGVVKVVVSTTNTEGVSKSKSATRDLKDAKSPLCGKVTYENNNKMNDYNSGTSISCGQSGYAWIGLGNATKTRQVWVKCNDEFGTGCAQHEYSKNLTTDGENDTIYLKDQSGNVQSESDKCVVKKCMDFSTPKITVNIYKANTSGNKTGNALYSYSVGESRSEVNYSTTQKNNDWLNYNTFPNGVYVEVEVADPLSKLKSYSWKINPKNKKEGSEGNATDTIETKTWNWNTTGNNKYTKGKNITDDGVRLLEINAKDHADNSTTFKLTIKVDRTAPKPTTTTGLGDASSAPKIYMYKETTTTGTSTGTAYTNNSWYNKYVWVNTDHPADKPDISGWKTNQYASTGAHGSYNNVNANDVHINNEGVTTIKFRACDNAGNCTAYSAAKAIKLDRQVPTCTVTNSGGTAGTGGWYKGGTVTATGTCTDQNNLSKCVNNTVQVQKVNSDSSSSAGTTATKDVYDNAGNKGTCTSTIKYDKSKPTCSIAKTHTGTTVGVTLTTTCTEHGHSGIKTCESQHTKVKSNKTYTVKDNAGNSNTCSKSVTAQRQRSNCSQCKSGSCSGSCASYEQVCSSWCCKEPSTAGGSLHYVDQCSPTKPIGGRCPANSDAATCGGYTNGSCKSWNASCSKCGCNSWGGWYNVSSCSSSSSVQCQTVYN